MRGYPAILTKEESGGAVNVVFPDVPEALTFGMDRAQALRQAVEALESGLSFYVERRQPLPKPGKVKRGMVFVPLSALGAAKAALYEAMLDKRLSKSALARKLNCHLPQIDRLIDLSHASKLEQVERALLALGKRLVVDVAEAA